MVDLIFSPLWFMGKDIIIDIFSMIILFLIAFFSFKCYKTDKCNKNHFYLSLSFLMIGLSFLFKIFTNFVVYKEIVEKQTLGLLTIIHTVTVQAYLPSYLSSILQKSFMLIGLYFLYVVLEKNKTIIDHVMVISLLLLITHLSHMRHLYYYITVLVMLSIISAKYYLLFKKNKQRRTKYLSYSFVIIATSQILFFFITKYKNFYVLGEIVQAIGYVMLLVIFIMVLKRGKKKR